MSSTQGSKSGIFHLYNSSSSPSILKKCKRQTLNNVPARKVHFNLFNNIKLMLINYDKNNDRDKIYYNNLICDIRDSASEIKDSELIQLLKDARNCINILDENFTLFVKVILIFKWMNRSNEVIMEYRAFLLDVCTAHNYHTKFAIEQLVACFSYVDCAVDNYFNGTFSDEEERKFLNVHITLTALLKAIPLAKDLLMAALKKNFLCKKNNVKAYHYYIHNLLNICKYEPSLRKNILSIIINKLIEIDVHIPKDELHRLQSNVNVEVENIFSLDIDYNNTKINAGKVEVECFSATLDVCLKEIFIYLKTTCHNADGTLLWINTKLLYHELLSIFENEILPTYNSSHIQYIIYYFLSFKLTLAENFSNWLWKKCCDVSSPSTLRQASAGYLASFLCRYPFISNSILKDTLYSMSLWCNSYIKEVDKLVTVVNEDLLRQHAVFYSMCQALFYIISFRHQDLTDNTQKLRFMENLHLSNIVTCKLSPLRLCCTKVVDCFAYITKTYQLTYCYMVMDGHVRVTDQSIKDEWLYSFFPFEPYILPRSKSIIVPNLYREIDIANNHSKLTEQTVDNIPLSLTEHSDISPSMVLSPSPTKTDWLQQFTCENNKSKFI